MKHGLYVITDTPLLEGRLVPAVEAALQGGAVVVQYRDKSTDTTRRLEDALALRMLCRRYQVPLLINDDVELCVAAGADGVHLGQQDGSLQQARSDWGRRHHWRDLPRLAGAGGVCLCRRSQLSGLWRHVCVCHQTRCITCCIAHTDGCAPAWDFP
jgi:hypothetical protein